MTSAKDPPTREEASSHPPQDLVKDLITAMALPPEHRRLVEYVCAPWVKVEEVLDTAAEPSERELLIKVGRSARQQLDQALAEQHQGKEKLGQILARKGWPSEPELAALLAFQERLATAGVQHPGPLQLGNLLVSARKFRSERFEDGIRRQLESKKRVGEALVEAEYATENQITQGLSLQRVLLGAALSALLLLSLAPGKARAVTAAESSQMRISATVDPYVRLEVLQQQPSLTITAADIQRGYVDVAAGTRLRTRTNDHNGVLVNFDSRSNLFERVSVAGIGGTAEIGSGGGSIRAAYEGPESTAEVSYRFYLAQGAQSGNHPWPLEISAFLSY